MGKGFIKVQLFSAKNVMPVCGGNIFIIESTAVDFEDGKVLTTDECGISKTATVNTPDKSVGENSASKDIPYSSYDIYVRAKGYRDIAIEGIHVFPDMISIQKVDMIPTKKERAFMEEAEFIFIPSHQLLGLTPRDKVESLKVGSSNSLLAIPQYITVHLGAPSSYAENITLSFIDYIKNVTSSEIYPTWPEEAIRANIYAEISFALNRIQTEWYKNMGYAFEITNCITYDQAFIRGRNIYENVSRIVDELFNEYVVNKESKAPILAQCCSGTTISCSGLSQWGTVTLANNGSTASEIIKNYFGNDMVIEKLLEIEGIEDQYAGDELKVGSKGKTVEKLQNMINRIADNYNVMNKVKERGGDYNKDTETAVKLFQEIFNIKPTGTVNRITWYKISEVYNNITTLSTLKEEGEKEYNTGVSPEYLLRYGDSGAAVREFQCYLSLISKYYSVIPPLKIDGEFGVYTKAAVLAFQKKFRNIDVDGIVGKQTWDKIYEVYCDLK